MTAKQWAEAEALWETGDVTLDDLAKKFGRNRSSLSRHFTEHGIKQGALKEEHKKIVGDAVRAAAVDESTVLASRIRETKEEHYKMSTALAKLVWSEVLKAKQDGAPMSSIMNNVKSLDIAATALKKLREERWSILGLDKSDFIDEDGLPDLMITELTNAEIEALRARDEADLDLDVSGVVTEKPGPDVEDEDDDDVVEES